MDSNQFGGLVGLLLFLILPVVIGLILIIKARALVIGRLRHLSDGDAEHLEPSGAAIMGYRIAGLVLMAIPIILFLAALLAPNQNP